MKIPNTYSYILQAGDVDFRNNARRVSVCNYIMQAAGEDADKNGFGVRDLNCENCSWVLSRVAFEFYKELAQYEQIIVKTWVSDVNRIMTTRNMILEDADGNKVGAAVTLWSIIDLDKRAPLDIRQHVESADYVIDIPSAIEKPGKIALVAPDVQSEHKVVYSDIDFNCHVNSMKYLEWMIDMVDIVKMRESSIARIEMNFLHEALLSETLKIGRRTDDVGVDYFEILGKDTGTSICRAVISWR